MESTGGQAQPLPSVPDQSRASAGAHGDPSDISERRGSPSRGVVAILAVMVLLATAGRWYSASRLFDPSSPSAGRLSGDEVVYLLLGDRLVHEGRYTTRGIEQIPGLESASHSAYLQAPLFKHPPLFPVLVGLSRLAGGGRLASGFVPNLTFSAISMIVVFLLARELGFSPAKALLPSALVAVSPVHWICSARIWLDMPMVTLVLLAVWCQVRGARQPSWLAPAGFFWGCAALTKYVALVAWLGAATAVCVSSRGLGRSRYFWTGQALTAVMVAAWLLVRWYFEGPVVAAFWNSSVEDWRMFTSVLKTLWVLPVIVTLLLLLWRVSALQRRSRDLKDLTLGWGTILFGAAWFVNLFGWNFFELPHTSWSLNPFADSARTFYVAREVLFEPISWIGMVAIVVPAELSSGSGWTQVRLMWLWLFIFLTCWGNFQLRFGLILVPWECLAAAALLRAPRRGGTPLNTVLGIVSIAWLLLSMARSLWIVRELAMVPDYFYF